MNSTEIRKRFLDFFKKRGHKIVPSSSLIPDDPSVLLTTAGMQQFKPYLTGKADPEEHFGNRNVFSIQKSFRTTDIDEVGDTSHLTFFEMVGNFSFGGYFKEGAIPLSFEFITSPEGLGINPQKLFVTAFKGDDEVPRDDEAVRLWQEQFAKVGMSAEVGERIFLYGREKNWWEAGPGPAGPDAEMFYDFGTPHDPAHGSACHPNCDCGRFVEIGNDVFVQYNKTSDGKYQPLSQKAIDNGRGFERLVMIIQGKNSIFDTDLFRPLIEALPTADTDQRVKRIIADHCRAAAFLIADGVRPSNKGAGYILRRLLRRAIVHADLKRGGSFRGNDTFSMGYESDLKKVFETVVDLYGSQYPEIQKETVLSVFDDERKKFGVAFRSGLREIKRIDRIGAREAFKIYESYGLPYELVKEFSGEKSRDLEKKDFDAEFARHQETSRAGVEKKFGGHGLLLDTGELKAGDKTELEKVTRLHTATHLLNSALHQILGDTVEQRGSDITVERARFDFRFPRKVEPAELQKIEDMVNANIAANLPVSFEEMDLEQAKESGALYFSRGRYPDRVKVYTIGHDREVISRELCGGPHVGNTGAIGKFKITKEESSSAGVRRVRMVIEP